MSSCFVIDAMLEQINMLVILFCFVEYTLPIHTPLESTNIATIFVLWLFTWHPCSNPASAPSCYCFFFPSRGLYAATTIYTFAQKNRQKLIESAAEMGANGRKCDGGMTSPHQPQRRPISFRRKTREIDALYRNFVRKKYPKFPCREPCLIDPFHKATPALLTQGSIAFGTGNNDWPGWLGWNTLISFKNTGRNS